jgi:hypothetical protein
MPCTRCNGTCANDQCNARIDAQGQWRLGAWRWASRCPTCGTMVEERAERLAADASAHIDRTNPMPVFQMF